MSVGEALLWRLAEPVIMVQLEEVAKIMDARPNRLWSSAEIAELMRSLQKDLKDAAKEKGWR